MNSKVGGVGQLVKVSHRHTLEVWILSSWLVFIVNPTQPRVAWEEGTSVEELSTLNWPVVLFVRTCLH